MHEFVVTELIPLKSEFANAPDIFEGSRWRSRVKSSQDAEIQRYVAMMEELEKRLQSKGCGTSMCQKNMAVWKSATLL